MAPWLGSGNGLDPVITPIYRKTAGSLFPIELRNAGAVVWRTQSDSGQKTIPMPARIPGDILILTVFAVGNDPGIPIFDTPGKWNDIETSGSYTYRQYECTAAGDSTDGAQSAVAAPITMPWGAVMCSFKNNLGLTYTSKGAEYSWPGFTDAVIMLPKTGSNAPNAGQHWLRLCFSTCVDQSPTDTSPAYTENFVDPTYKAFLEFQYDAVDDNTLFGSMGWQYLAPLESDFINWQTLSTLPEDYRCNGATRQITYIP